LFTTEFTESTEKRMKDEVRREKKEGRWEMGKEE
jgi:hypothetical protein